MKTIIRILIDEKLEKDIYEVDVPMVLGSDATLSIGTKGDIPFEEVLANVDKEQINKKIDYLKYFYSLHEDLDVDLSSIKDADSLLDNAQIYMFDASRLEYDYANDRIKYEDYEEDFSREEISEITHNYILANPFFKDKTIVVNDIVNVNSEISDIKDRYEGYEKIYVKPQDGIEPIPLETLENPMKKFISDVKKLELSPLELSILVYDFVREKVYKKESDNQSPTASRDLYQALQNDEIVCMGYANIYSEIMNQLGVRCEVILLDGIDNEQAGHARNLIKLYDDDYDVHGLFMLDPTYDSRNNDEEKEWLYKYRFFMKKRKDFARVDKKERLDDLAMGYLDKFSIDDYDTIAKFYSMNPIDMFRTLGGFDENYKKSHKLVHILDKMYEDDYDINESNERNINTFKKNHSTIARDYNETLDASVFFKALAKVRFIESKMDPDKYPYDINELYRHIPTYFFDEKNEQSVINLPYAANILLSTIFGEPMEEITYNNDDERRELIQEGYKVLAIRTHRDIMSDDKNGVYKVVKSIKLYNNKDKKNKKK